MLSADQRMLGRTDVDVCKIASLGKILHCIIPAKKVTYRTGQSIGEPFSVTRIGCSTQRDSTVA
jgi:hypothetical protein